MCACTESDVRESATRLQSKRLINFTLGLKVRQCALLSTLLTHSAIGSYTSDPWQMLFRLHAHFPVSSTVERTVFCNSKRIICPLHIACNKYMSYMHATTTAKNEQLVAFVIWKMPELSPLYRIRSHWNWVKGWILLDWSLLLIQ
jgi:hypothetical protein